MVSDFEVTYFKRTLTKDSIHHYKVAYCSTH